MIALLLLLQAIAVPQLQTLPRQALPARGCAAYLWSRADRRLVAVASGDPASLRVALGARAVDYPRMTQAGVSALGLAERTSYRMGDTALTLEMTIAARGDLTNGAAVPDGVLTVTSATGDVLVVPVAGLIGCRAAVQAFPEIGTGSVR